LTAIPFVPFRITLISGSSYEIHNPDWVRLMRTYLILFTPSEDTDVFARADRIGLNLIERIEPLDVSTPHE
jgi:hypothetical protein